MAKFKGGDEVRVKAGITDIGVVLTPKEKARKYIVKTSHSMTVVLDYRYSWDASWLEPWNPAEEWDGSKWVAKKVSFFPEHLKEICSPYTKAHIVINRHASGQLKPASNPHVHANYDSAKAAAQRLADTHKGEEFCVFGLKDVVKVEKSPAELMHEQLQKERDDGELMEFSCGHGTLYAKAKIESVARVADKVTVVYSEIKGA